MDGSEKREIYYDYEEIDLRDIINTLKKWKKTIILTTAAFMLLSGIISFFILKPVYEAQVVLTSANNKELELYDTEKYILREESDVRRIKDQAVDLYLSPLYMPQEDISQYGEIARSGYILNQVISNLNLDITYHELSRKINVEKGKDTNFITIKVQDQDPKKAALIANNIAEELSWYVKEKEAKNLEQSFAVLDEQLSLANQELDLAVKKMRDFKVENLGEKSGEKKITYDLTYQKLQQEIQRKKDAVDLLEAKRMELRIREAFLKNQERVVILSPAVEPEVPVKPNKKLNIAVAGVLGLMISIFGVFLAEYLREEETEA